MLWQALPVRVLLALLPIVLTACSEGEEAHAPNKEPLAQSTDAVPWLTSTGAESPQSADPVVCGDGSGSGPEHAKSCYFAACKSGDKAACDIMTSPKSVRELKGTNDGSPRLEDMDYLEARKIILGFGWIPLGGPCEGILNEETCREFPELGNCSGTGLGFCDMTFRRADRCLTVVTTGGEPSLTSEYSTQVDWVRFHGGPCSKDPNAAGT